MNEKKKNEICFFLVCVFHPSDLNPFVESRYCSLRPIAPPLIPRLRWLNASPLIP